ncbi:MAG: hypothetical protein JXQ75_10145 [Phycisphaerae bacterium]|nr:hypothetical protein [Phycisphaerae bacterium]
MHPIKRIVTGNQAVAQAALWAGCDFFAAQPAAAVASTLDEFGLAFGKAGVNTTDTRDGAAAVQACSAAAAVERCVEAAACGARAMAATAGSALRACGEQIGLAQMAEIPMVLVHCQHVGYGDHIEPAAGDGDVALARHLTPGSLPLPVLAATDAASSYRLTCVAFDVAERLRTPVVLLTSRDIALIPQAVALDGIDLPPAVRVAGIPSASSPPTRPGGNDAGAPSFARKGTMDSGPAAVAYDALIADPAGLEARLTRLSNKITDHRDFLQHVEADPDPDAQTLLVSYGLADQAASKAVKLVRSAGSRVSHLTIHSLWPMPEAALRRALTPYVSRILMPELNMGLYADELSRIVKAVKIESILRCDGGLIDPQTIARRITDWPCG